MKHRFWLQHAYAVLSLPIAISTRKSKKLAYSVSLLLTISIKE